MWRTASEMPWIKARIGCEDDERCNEPSKNGGGYGSNIGN